MEDQASQEYLGKGIAKLLWKYRASIAIEQSCTITGNRRTDAKMINKDWDSIYKQKGILQTKPSDRVVQAISYFKQKGLHRILDLGCGTGRHTTLLLKEGFEVYGCDSSESALAITEDMLKEAHFECCDMTSLSYSNDLFDGVLCNHVLQHGRLADIRIAISEMRRVLRKGGVIFLVVVSINHPKYLTGEEIEPGTKVNTDAIDGHIPHHFFTEAEMMELFADFDNVELEHFEGPNELEPSKITAAWQLYAQCR